MKLQNTATGVKFLKHFFFLFCFVLVRLYLSSFWWLVGLFLYIVPWSPGDFDKGLWSKTAHFPTFPKSPPTLTPRTILLLKKPSSNLHFPSPSPRSLHCSRFPPSLLSWVHTQHPSPISRGTERAGRARTGQRRVSEEGRPECRQDSGYSKSGAGGMQARGKPPQCPVSSPL